MLKALLLLGLVAAAHAGLFIQDGQEYEYRSIVTATAGTMDVATHSSGESYKMKVRLQASGRNLNVEISDLERSMFVGGHLPTEDPFENTNYVKVDMATPVKFKVTLDSAGKFQSLTLASGMNVFQKNLAKGWAQNLQVDAGQISQGKKAFKSEEKSLMGNCQMSYTVSDNMLVKSVAHLKDCTDKPYRNLDDVRGWRCDADWSNPRKVENPEGLYSQSNTVYMVGMNGGQKRIERMDTHGVLVAQFFQSDGGSYLASTNITSILSNQRSSSGDISVSGETLNTLVYEFADQALKWDEDRDLKAREPWFGFGEWSEVSQSEMKSKLIQAMEARINAQHSHDNSDAHVQMEHRTGPEVISMLMAPMSYDTLWGIMTELSGDKSEMGIAKSNMFNEYLGNIGSSAAAMVVRDMIMQNKFENDRDAGRVLTSVPFHVKRPNKQLVREYEKLLNWGGAQRFLKMAIPLAFGNLVRTTCMRAGNLGDATQVECYRSFASGYVTMFWQKFKDADNREDKIIYLDTLKNIRHGGVADKVKPLLYGQMDEETEMKTAAVWVAGWDAAVKYGIDYFFPIFANQQENHETRISALAMIFYSNPSTTDMARILAILKTETNYEIINFAYSIFDQFANTINPCHEEVGKRAKYFLKFMKQYSQYETDWGFGVSKTYVREYQQRKYGYGGSYGYYVVGSDKSTTPVSLGMSISNTFFQSYQSNALNIHLRIEGMAKGLIRKFKSMDPGTWKTNILDKILKQDMGIRERADQPVKVHIGIMVKGATVISRSYDDQSAGEGGRLQEFMSGFMDMGDQYNVNHVRAIQLQGLLYEQPSVIGLPLAYYRTMTMAFHLKATVKRGQSRGTIFRDLEYEINVMGQGTNGMMTLNPMRKEAFAIAQSRIYHIHVPRKVVIGVNPIRKELKLSISRPTYDDPAMVLMHSATKVAVWDSKWDKDAIQAQLSRHCSTCSRSTVVSKGPGAARQRIVRDMENEKLGYYNHMEYFDCEMDISETNARGRALMAFMPYNKNPKTLGSIISGGFRQILAYLILYPRVEKCGIYTRWSQSQQNPVTDIEVTVRYEGGENGARMFFRGRKTKLKAYVKANGQPQTRAYRIQLTLESTPGNIHNKVKIQVDRSPIPELGITPYIVCMAYESKYPDFSREFLALTMGETMKVEGRASLQYGEGTSCGSGQGEIKVDFKHETTQDGYDSLANKWYYKKCMEQKNSPEWSTRGGNKLPATEPCYMAMWDATNARKYTWNVDFVKLTNRMRNIITKTRSLIQAGLTPYWDADPEEYESEANGNELGAFLNAEVTIHDEDRLMDAKIETSQGESEYKDYPLKLNWSKRLRNLKFTSTIKKLMDMKIIAPCTATIGSVRTMDNVTYPYNAGSCWTLTSSHCGPNPVYAVFSKKVGNKLAIRAYFGGHSVEISPSGDVKVNGASMSLPEGEEKTHSENGQEIFKLFKWGSTVNVYSFLRVWVSTDNTFVQVMPAPSTRGQHCGLCGTFNRNVYDEWMGKDGQTMVSSADAMVNEWKWQC